MDDRCRQIIGSLDRSQIDRVATGVIGSPVTVIGEPVLGTLVAPHAEKRTVGVVKLSGTARLADSSVRDWSTVAKLVDLGQEPDNWTRWTRPEIEETVYEERYFAEDGSRFRPARCYLVSKLDGGIRIFWLEDLTGARRMPFSVAELAQMTTHLGEWTGAHLTLPRLKFELPTDIFAVRADLPVFLSTYEAAKTLDPAAFRPYYGDVPVSVAHEFRALFRRQNERIKGHPHALAFGDCQIGNLFLGDGETIAVDWTSLANDPVGADGGAMVGSAFTWGKSVSEVARHERELFEAYLRGLKTAGWRGNRDDVRRGYFSQFAHYLFGAIAMMPVLVEREVWPRAVLEERFGVRREELADLVKPIMALLPGYVEELHSLAN